MYRSVATQDVHLSTCTYSITIVAPKVIVWARYPLARGRIARGEMEPVEFLQTFPKRIGKRRTIRVYDEMIKGWRKGVDMVKDALGSSKCRECGEVLNVIPYGPDYLVTCPKCARVVSEIKPSRNQKAGEAIA